MRAAAIAFLVLLALAAFAEVATAQPPVTKCTQQCRPQDKDVNNPPLRRNWPVNVILYSHWEHILTSAPLNTDPPGQEEKDLQQQFLMPVLVTRAGLCVAVGCADFRFQNNRFTMYFCPGQITYMSGGWRLGCHDSPLPGSLRLSGTTIPVYWYMSADAIRDPSGTSVPVSKIGAIPHVGVYANLETGPRPGKGMVVAEGHASRVNLVSLPTGPDAFEIRIDIRAQIDAIPAVVESPGFMINVRPYQLEAGVVEFMQAEWRIRTGPLFMPRVILPLVEPLQVTHLQTDVENRTLSVDAHILANLGSYDLDADTIELHVSGPTGVPAESIDFTQWKAGYAHCCLPEPAKLRWEIDLDSWNPKAGSYRFEVTVRNNQGTFEVHRGVDYVVATFDAKATVPSVPADLLVLSLLALVVALRTSRRPPGKD